MTRTETLTHDTPRHAAVCHALEAANIDLDNVVPYGITITPDRIEYLELERHPDGSFVTDHLDNLILHRRNTPNPGLAPTP